MYHVEYSKKAQKQIRKLDRAIQRLLFAWIDKNLEGIVDPRSKGKGLLGDHSGEWRYRIGDFRLICDIQDEKMIVLALEIGHRKDIY